MIRDETDYHQELLLVLQDRDVAARQREALAASGLAPDEVDRAMEPLLSFQAQRAEEIAGYESARRRGVGEEDGAGRPYTLLGGGSACG